MNGEAALILDKYSGVYKKNHHYTFGVKAINSFIQKGPDEMEIKRILFTLWWNEKEGWKPAWEMIRY